MFLGYLLLCEVTVGTKWSYCEDSGQLPSIPFNSTADHHCTEQVFYLTERMVYLCVAAGCSNITANKYYFAQVSKRQSQKSQIDSAGTKDQSSMDSNSVFLSLQVSISLKPVLKSRFRSIFFWTKKRRRFKPDAIPTIFHRLPAAVVQTIQKHKRGLHYFSYW